MADLHSFGLFLAAAVVLVAAPGPNHLYIIARSVSEGRRAGIVSALGVESGTLIHIGVAAAGVSYLIAQSALAFQVVKYLGVAYLTCLGVRTLMSRGDARVEGLPARNPYRVYVDGLLVNLFNPKLILFFLAFLPQFVDPASGPVPVQIVGLGLVLLLIGVSSDLLYAVAAGSIGAWSRSRPAFRRGRRAVTGAVYLALAAVAAFVGVGGQRSS